MTIPKINTSDAFDENSSDRHPWSREKQTLLRMEKILIFTHVGGGILVLLTGLLIIATKKGTKTHVNIGWLYVLSIMMI